MGLLALIFLGGVAALLLLGGALWAVARGEQRAHLMLQKWINENNFVLLERTAPWIKDNPFFGSSNRSQKVFYITLRQSDGQIRRAWVRCGHALWGVWVEQVEVKWDKRPASEIEGEDSDLRNQLIGAP